MKENNYRKKVTCPDCKQPINPKQISNHIKQCKKYQPTFYKQTLKMAQYMNQNYLQFLIAQLQLTKQQLKYKMKDNNFDQEDQQYSNQIQKRNQKYKQDFDIKQIEKQQRQNNKHNQINGAIKQKQTDKGYTKQQHRQYLMKNEKKDNLDLLAESFDVSNKKKHYNIEQNQKQIINLVQQNSEQRYPFQNRKIMQQYQQRFIQQKFICNNCQSNINSSNMKQFTYADQCLHVYCMRCIKGYIQNQYVQNQGNMPCLIRGCDKAIPQFQIKQIMGPQKYQALSNKLLIKVKGNLTICVKCGQGFQFIQGNPKDAPKQDNQGKPIPPTKCIHYAKNRFICSNQKCKQQQCKQCKCFPYHLGMDCQQYKKRKNSKKCRYCDDSLKLGYTSNLGIKAFDDICDKPECQQKTKIACAKIKLCKHSCYGYKNEKYCLPCLNQKCAKENKYQLKDQTENDYCSICYIQGLNTSPCVMSQCGHIYHYKCLQKILNTRWLTPRIFFNFCHCPLCKSWIDLPADCPLQKKIQDFKRMERKIEQMAIKRLEYEGNDKDEKLKDPKSPYKDNPVKYAMAIYAYFQCFKCKNAYFGGRKNCAQAMNERQNSVDFKPEQLVCPNCCPIAVQKCQKHGKQFISFKCKFCCSIAQWFCWGNTHFCDDCHKKQCSGEYISKLPKQKLPKCEGVGKCPIGGNHNGNGQQRSMGCGLCLDYKSSSKNF